MRAPIHLVVLVLGVLLFLAAGFPTEPWPWRPKLIAFGLACCWLSTLITI